MSAQDQSAPVRVLLVDDEPSIRAVYPIILRSTYEVDVASTGREGLRALASRSDYDVIVCDLSMPDVDGPAFYEALSASTPHLLERLVFFSGGLMTARLRTFVASVPNLFLEKPITVEALCAAIERVRHRALLG